MKNGWLVLLLIFCLVYFTFYEWDALATSYVVNDDAAQHIAWMHKWGDNQITPGDPLIEVAEVIQPWGFGALSWVAGLFLEPISVSKYLPLFPLLATCFFCFFLVKKRFGPVIAFATAVLLSSATFERMIGFNARAFAFPLLLAFSFFWLDKKTKGISIVLVLSALFYPVVLLIELAIIGFEVVFYKILQKTQGFRPFYFDRKKLGWLVTSVLVSLSIAFAKSKQIQAHPFIGSSFSKSELMNLAEFGAAGRVNFKWENKSLTAVLKDDFQDRPYGFALIVVLIALLVAEGYTNDEHRDFVRLILFFLLAGLTLHLLAKIFLLKLFLPLRYFTYTYPVFIALAFAFLTGIRPLLRQERLPGILLAAAMVFQVFFFYTKAGNSLVNFTPYARLYEVIQQLPGNGMIAGPPAMCDQVTLFCGRSVLVSNEAGHALYFKNYRDLLKPRLTDFIDAYTSPEEKVLKDFVKKYQIQYLLIDRNFFEGKDNLQFFEPLLSYYQAKMEENPHQQFAIGRLPPEFFIPVDENFSILDCRKLFQ